MDGSVRLGLSLPLLSCLIWSCGFYLATHALEDDRIIIEPPSPIVIPELGTINITCRAVEADITVGYEWRKLGNSEFLVPGQNLYLSQILTSQAGEYVCHVTKWGDWTASASVQVIVEYFPRWVAELPQKFASDVGERASLMCSVRAYPAVTFWWSFGGTVLPQVTSDTDYVSMYTIETVQQQDYGTYTCNATNNAGSNLFQLELQPPGIPDAPFSCEVLNVSNVGAEMACIPGFSGGADLSFKVQKTGTFVNTKFVPTTTTWVDQMAIVSCEGLYPNFTYILGVFAENEYGLSAESLAVSIRTLDIPLPTVLPLVEDDLPLLAIIGGIVGGIIIIVVIVIISVVCTRHRKGEKSPPGTPTSSLDPALSGRPSPTGTIETEVDENRFNRERERASMRGVSSYDFDEGGFGTHQPSRFNREPQRRSKRSSMGKGNRNSFGKGGWLRRSFGRQSRPRNSYYDTDYGGTSYEEFEKQERARGDGTPYAIQLQGFDNGETSDFAYNNTAYIRSQENLRKPARPNTRPGSQYSSSQGSRPTSYFIPTDAEAMQNAQSMGSHQPSLAGMGALASFPILNPITGQEMPRSPSRHSSRPSLSPSNESVNRRPDRPPLTGQGQQDPMRYSPYNVRAAPHTPTSPNQPFDPFVLNIRNLDRSPPYSASEQGSSDRQSDPFIQKPLQKVQPFGTSTENMGKPTAHVNPLSQTRNQSASSYSLPEEFWEFPRDKLYIRQKIGDGVMGEVWRARAEGICGRPGQTVVAMKTLKDDFNEEERRSILRELRVMKSLQPHPNIIALLGCCTKQDPPYIIMEYAARGTLQKLLRSYRLPWTAEPADKYSPYANLPPVRKLTSRDLTVFALQICDGMDYISSKDLLHRDLAARNILVDEEYICKVSDFGFARDVAQSRQYESRTQNRLPLRWMAPEALFDCMYTTKSDVWSFGVLLWEMVTLGSSPYPGITGPEVMELLQEGFRMEKPHLCSDQLYMIMRECWQVDPRQRPTFFELRQRLDNLLQHGSQVELFVDQMRDNFYEIFEDLPGEKC